MLTLLVLGLVAWNLRSVSGLRLPVRALGALLALQLATGVSNVVLGWPLLAAVLHTGGAGAMVVVMVWMLASTQATTAADRTQVFQRRVTE